MVDSWKYREILKEPKEPPLRHPAHSAHSLQGQKALKVVLWGCGVGVGSQTLALWSEAEIIAPPPRTSTYGGEGGGGARQREGSKLPP